MNMYRDRKPLDLYELCYIQDRIHRLLTLYFSGTYLSNLSKIFYPIINKFHRDVNQELTISKKILCSTCNIKYSDPLNCILANSIKWFNENVNDTTYALKKANINISQKYNKIIFIGPKLAPINRLCEYTTTNLAQYLVDGYLHGSVSSMDYTEYSDLDTLFIIKKEVLENAKEIKKLARLFIKSNKFLYEFDPLQHHGHFFLMETDLKCYNQAILPLPAIRLSTSILGQGMNLVFSIRDSKDEIELRFLESIQIIRRYATKDVNRLNSLYYLKGFLSHFMILPVLFLQLKGEYVSKKESFEVLRKRIGDKEWQCVQKVSSIRKNWRQFTSSYKNTIMKIINKQNPLLFPYVARLIYQKYPLCHKLFNPNLLHEMYDFTIYLFKLSGLNASKLEY